MDLDVERLLGAVERTVSTLERDGRAARAVTLARSYPHRWRGNASSSGALRATHAVSDTDRHCDRTPMQQPFADAAAVARALPTLWLPT